MKRFVPAHACLISLVVCGAFSRAAHADEPAAAPAPDAVSPAKALFKEGRALVAQGDYRAACPKFEQSLALEAGLGTQFNLADCWEHVGRTASAQALFIGAAASAKAAGQSDREQVLRDRAAALEPRIPRLVIEVAETDPKLTVKRGDLPLDADTIGKAKAVDAGSYEIIAKAPGKKTWTKKVEVAAGAGIVTVEVPKLEADDEVAVPAPDAQKPKEKITPPPDLSDNSSAHHGPSATAVTIGVVGLGGLAFGAYMATKYSSANADAKNICPTSVGCSSVDITVHDQKVEDARGYRNQAYVGLGVGVVGLGAAAALLFLPRSPQKSATHSAWSATPVVTGNGSFGASVSGQF